MALSPSDVSDLLDVVRAGGDLDVVRQGLEPVLQALIEAEATEVIGAEPHQRTESRTNQRNGTRPRLLSTKAGDVELSIPKLRRGSFFPSVLERRRAQLPGSDTQRGAPGFDQVPSSCLIFSCCRLADSSASSLKAWSSRRSWRCRATAALTSSATFVSWMSASVRSMSKVSRSNLMLIKCSGKPTPWLRPKGPVGPR